MRARHDVKGDRLLGSDGRVWPAFARLWTYAVLSGVCAVVVGQVIVFVTHTVLPAAVVRPTSIVTMVAAAGLAAEHVLGRQKGRPVAPAPGAGKR
jgi:hypothetical protein